MACALVSTAQATGTAKRILRLVRLRFRMQISIHEDVPIPLAYDFDVDGPIALASTAAWFAGASVRETIGPSRCNWCETNGFDVGLRNALRWGDPQAAEIGAIVIGFAIGPAAILASDLAAAAHDRSWKS